ncbi:hypothetical protein SAMN05444169_2985 [Bradyrhizobium erythrophlei]|jgi:hypothetical protein|uniref:Uncharacterized protein n=1 Tax=Bradyrhizobium erythrophlei TaxID=1437360 RepID=A0A1M5KP76_9BRAD|nr:hypothetical protein SAMN05444169_2985 [Bradyrhizobium erythrophlei]
MTGDQSRLLKPLDRVCSGVTTTDLGTVIETDCAGVSKDWDNGQTTAHVAMEESQVWSTRSPQPVHKPKCPNCNEGENENPSARKES